MFEEQPQGPTEVDNRPLDEKIGDKNWKARVSAYEELRRELKNTLGDDPMFEEYARWVPKMTADSNAGALDAGLDTALVFVDMCPQVSLVRGIAESVCHNVIDKAFGTRSVTLAKGKLLIMKLMEVDDCSTCSTVMLSKLSDKKPKVPPTCLELFEQGIASFGARAFPVKELIAALGPVLGGSNAPAREAAMAVLLQLYKWIGRAPLNSTLEGLKPAQKADFDRMCSEHDASGSGAPTPSLYLRKSRPAPGSVGAGSKPAASAVVEPAIDAREFVEEVDLTRRLKSTDYDTLIAEEKWSEQLRGLQIVVDVLGATPKVKPGTDVTELLSVIKGLLRQGHVQLQTTSLKILTLLADGMRAEFGPAVRPLTQTIIGKAKEKRLVPDVHSALVSILTHCLTMEVFIEDLAEQIKNKKTPPHARVCLMEFVAAAVSTCTSKVSTDCLKPLTEMHIACCEDSDVKVRDVSSAVLAVLAPLVKTRGRSAVEAHRLLMGLEQSAPRVFKKMQAAMEGAPVAAVAVAAPPAPAVKAPVAKAEKPASLDKPVAKKPAAPTAASSATMKKATSSAASSRATAGADDKEDDNVDDVSMSVEDAQAALAVLGVPNWESGFQALATSAKWQDRVDAYTTLGEAIKTQDAGGAVSVPLVAYLKGHNNGFKMSNVNIVKAVMQAASTAAQSVGSGDKFSKSAAWELIKAFGDRFSDKKTLEASIALCTALCEATSPSFVVKRMRVVMEKTKAPAAHQAYLEWLKGTISDFGASAFPIQSVAAFCKEEMDNKIAGVRTAAVEVVGALYHQIGPRVQSIAISDDCKPQLRALLEAEFAKVGHDPAAAGRATRAVKGEEGSVAGGGLSIPRQDLTAIMDKNILSELNCVDGKNSWQQRKVAMEAILAACEKSGHYLDANRGTVEIIRSFKARLNDTQANLKPMAASVMAHVISSLEADHAVKVTRVMAACLLSSVADSKKAMRDAAVAAIETIVTLNGTVMPADANLMAAVISNSAEALTNPVGRQELLQWIQSHAEGAEVRCDCGEIAEALVLCLQDKMAAVRSLAEGVLTSLIAKGLINRQAVDKATRDLAPATKRALQAPIERMMTSFGSRSLGPVEEAVAAAVAPEPIQVEKPSALLKKTLKPVPAKPTVAAPTAEPVADSSFPLKKTNKTRRNDEFYKQSWPIPPEDIGDSEIGTLKREWETQVTNSEFIHLLFPTTKATNANAGGQDLFIPAMEELLLLLQDSGNENIVFMHTDFILRWCTYVLCCRETTAGLLKLLQVITAVFELHRTVGTVMHDAEVGIVLPQLIDRAGHKQDRQKAAFKAALTVAEAVCAPAKMCACLIQGLNSKNKKTRAVCLEEMEQVVAAHGYACLGKAGLKEVCLQLDSSDVGARNAALDLTYAIYACVGADMTKLYKLLGEVTDKAKSLVVGRIKERNKTAASLPPPVPMSAPVAAPEVKPVVRPVSPIRPVARSQPTQEIAADRSVVLRGGPRYSAESPGGELAFKLDMTPDSEPSPMPSRTPAADNVKVSLFGRTPEPASSVSIDGVYAEIASKVNTMIGLYSDFVSMHQQGVAVKASPQLVVACDDCREYMKMLHAMVTGNWAKTTTAATAAEDEAALIQNAEGLVLMVLTCLSLAFEGIGVSSRSATDMPVAVALDIDVSLVSVCLATLHALVKYPGVLPRLSSQSVIELVADCVLAISHDKLSAPSLPADAKEASVQIHRVLLLILAKSSQELGVARVVAAVLQSLFQCIIQVDHRALGDSTVTRRLLPPRCAKPLSKLLLKVLSDECHQTRPFVRLPATDIETMLAALHKFFSNHPSDLSGDDTPYCAAKTVLSQLVKSIGAASVLMTLQETLSIQPNSFVCVMTARLGNTDVGSEAKTVLDAAVNAVSPELHSTLVSIIDDITSSRDKMGAIKKLYVLIKSNPTLDVSQYLQRTSSVFRRYVLDTLQQMDEQKAKHSISHLSVLTVDTENRTARADLEDAINGNEGFEAMRIIEGLKKHPASPKMGRESSASRLAIHDKVRGSLTSLQESLFAGKEPVQISVTAPAPSVSNASGAVNPAAGVDDDLAARIARIRNVSKR